MIHATTLRIPVVELEGGSLTALAGFDGHQGVALVAQARQTATVDEILGRARQLDQPPFVLVLDSLEDPQNFGTLLRSAEAVGVHGVLYPTRGAAPLSPAAIKASAGATEHLLLAPVDDLPGALADLHTRGVRIAAAEEGAAMTYTDADFRGPLALVVGSEGKGISAPVRRRLDVSVRIPMQGKIGSLNAAVAGSVLLFAAAQQRPVAEPAKPIAETDEAADQQVKPEATARAKPQAKAKANPKSSTKAVSRAAPKPASKKMSTTNPKLGAGSAPEGGDEGLLPDS